MENLEAIQDAFQKAVTVDYKQAALLNREFHFGLISAARMPVVSKTLENMWVIMGPLLSRFHAEVPSGSWPVPNTSISKYWKVCAPETRPRPKTHCKRTSLGVS
ncbi:FCD domain-containing protein [Pseudomonas sp. RIT288]|uniref:FCD domain-containing protein n=1 Tax=Pseudomonas sp. RIT288 TaxID=1470589 RepID=UPI003FA7714D